MATHMISLNNISFQDTVGSDHLSFPKYPDLINDIVVNDNVRKLLQVEPAFQFLKTQMNDTFHFELKLDTASGAVFTEGAEPNTLLWSEVSKKLHSWSNPVPLPITQLIRDPTGTACSIKIDPALWPTDDRVLTLRIYCSNLESPKLSNTNHGVSITFISPGGSNANNTANKVLPATWKSDLNLVVLELAGATPDYPLYNIFRSKRYAELRLLNPDNIVSLEPAFRLGPGRANAKIAIQLKSHSFLYDDSTNDDVRVIEREPNSRPLNLSKVSFPSGAPKTASSAVHFEHLYPDQRNHFSFHLDLHEKHASLGQCPPLPLALAHVDPVLICEPPPAGIP